MAFRELAIPGAYEIFPEVYSDVRGDTLEWFTERGFESMTGHRFDMRQANCSVSAAGVLRGLHFARTPPGQAKYITCVTGAAFDVVVDIRIGSPTFGMWDSVVLDGRGRRSIYIAEGLAHGFLALEDNTTLMYMCSTPYTPQREHTISPTDPEIGVEWPISADQFILSDRDIAAPPLAEVRAADLLPVWDDTRASDASLPID